MFHPSELKNALDLWLNEHIDMECNDTNGKLGLLQIMTKYYPNMTEDKKRKAVSDYLSRSNKRKKIISSS